MNNTPTDKIKQLLQLFTWPTRLYFLSWSTITSKLDIYVYKYKDGYICKDPLQAIRLVTINIWLNLLLKINFYFDQVFIPSPKLICPFISSCTHFRNFPTYKNDNWFPSVTLSHCYIEVNSTSAKRWCFEVAERYFGVMIILAYPWKKFLPVGH